MTAASSAPRVEAGHPGLKVYKQSVIQTLPLLERMIFEYAGREGIIRIVDDVEQEVRA